MGWIDKPKATGNYDTNEELVAAIFAATGTRQEIADLTGASIGTVSRTLNPRTEAVPLKLDDYWRIQHDM
jgi:hypothetical protein